ncbi:MAG: hypothetical protein QMC78_00565 [Methanocellales archaeon]|nr:hypothetical protein [Methanocellales archaeon]
MKRARKNALIIAILFVLVIASMVQVKKQADPWLVPLVAKGEVEATMWIKENTSLEDRFAADIFGGELIMGMTTRIPLVGGDWANAPNAAQNMADAERIYLTTSPGKASSLCKEHNCTYVFVPLQRQIHAGYGWKNVETTKFSDANHFELAYENQDVQIYRVIY